MHSGLKNHKYGRDTRGSHMGAKDEPYGVRVVYHVGGSETRWFATEFERDKWYILLNSTRKFAIKSIKKKKR